MTVHKKLRVAVQMDPIGLIKYATDSTLALIFEAQDRGHDVWYYTPKDLTLESGRVMARAMPLRVIEDPENYYELGEAKQLTLAEDVDVVLLRQDPPFDMSYITNTYLLESIEDRVLVSNPASSVRNTPEKLAACLFPELMAPTLVTSDREAMRAFLRRENDIVIKPLYAFGGRDVSRISAGEMLDKEVDALERLYPREPLMLQKFLPEIVEGDKRLFIIDGALVGGIRRVPAEGSIKSNLAAGGTAVKLEITDRDQAIGKTIGDFLKKRGIIFAGIDVIGECLTEINVTCPTGLRAASNLHNINGASLIWDAIERDVIRLK